MQDNPDEADSVYHRIGYSELMFVEKARRSLSEDCSDDWYIANSFLAWV
jgi:hypothetical protein